MRKSRRKRRSVGTRTPLPRILIVTEGKQTEPTYFLDLCADYNLGSVDVDGTSDSNPLSVVEHGLQQFEREDYDRLYCVFDRDSHDGFADATDWLREMRNDEGWNVYWTYSIPCFEYWVLLHYTLTGRRFDHPDSPCGQVEREVNQYISGYSKGMTGLYDETKEHLDTAMRHAKQRWSQAKGRKFDDPSPRTKVHKLVNELRNLRSS